MSKNHPHDNIYSILGKLDALKPTQEEQRFALVKEIRESVEAQGSILSGVDAVQAKLARQFAESSGTSKDDIISQAQKDGMTKDMKHMGKNDRQIKYVHKKMDNAVKRAGGEKVKEDYASMGSGMGAQGGTIGEKAVSQAQQKFMGMAHAMQKGEKIKGASPELKKVAKTMSKKSAHDFAATKHKGLPQHVSEKYDPVKAVKKCAMDYMDAVGYDNVNQLEAEDIESIGMDCQMNYQDVCEILGINLPDSLGPVDSFGPDEHGNIVDFEESSCDECGMFESECSCPHTNEGITTHPSKGVTRHTKTEYPGYPTDDTEDNLDHLSGPSAGGKRGRPRKAQTKNPRPVVGAEKKGRGRPSKVAAPTYSTSNDPFGRVPSKAPKSKIKGTVHSMSEAMDLLGKQLGQLNEGRYLEDTTGETLNHILNRFRAEVRNFEQGGDLDKDLYDALFDYYSETGEMPYGTQKARTGDPMRWVAEKLEAELGDIAYGKDPANAEGHGLEQEAIGEPQPGIPGNLPVPGKMDRLNNPRDYYEEEVTMEDELNELARLAGIHSEGNAFTGKLKDTAKGDSFELDGKTFKDTSSLDETDLEEDDMEEGNEFSGELAKAKAQHKDSFEVDGKEYPVKESFEQPEQPEFQLQTSIDSDGRKTVNINAEGSQAEALLQMLKMAGLGSSDKAHELEANPRSVGISPGGIEVSSDEGSEEVEEADVSVDEPTDELANAPEPEYSTMRGSTMGPGEGDAGEKAMNPDRPTFKNGDNALSNPPARKTALEARLAAEYESIKKVTK